MFATWTGDVNSIADVSSSSTTITMNGDYTIRADFGIGIYDWYDLDAIRENLSGSYVLMNDLDSTTTGYAKQPIKEEAGTQLEPLITSLPGISAVRNTK